MSDSVVHMVMGQNEAKLVSLGLSVLLEAVQEDLNSWENKEEKSQDLYFEMLSTKFSAAQMLTSIWNLFGMPEEAIEEALDSIGKDSNE